MEGRRIERGGRLEEGGKGAGIELGRTEERGPGGLIRSRKEGREEGGVSSKVNSMNA